MKDNLMEMNLQFFAEEGSDVTEQFGCNYSKEDCKMIYAVVTVLLIVMVLSFILAYEEENEQLSMRMWYVFLITMFTSVLLVLVNMIMW